MIPTDLLTIRIKASNKRLMYIPGRVLAVFILLAILVIPSVVNPDRIPLPDCYFKSLTGYSCPTCGLTHSFHEITHLDLRSSFSHHLYGPILYAVLLFLFLTLIFEMITGKRVNLNMSSRIKKTVLIFAIAGWAGYWVVRFVHELQASM
jgi:hypothetical protein